MNIMIMTDMEGAAGVLNHDDWVMRSGLFFAKGQRFLTEEVNAAVDGLFEGGATDVTVIDGHGAGGIDPEILDERAKLLRASGHPFGLDAGFDGLCFVGQHAKAGTDYSHITHTQWFNYIDLAVNGISIGEYGQGAFCAMELGVPTILACGEEALCAEAAALTPGVITVSIKKGLLPDKLDHLDEQQYRKAKLDALHLPVKRARKLIREGALKAAGLLKKNPRAFSYPSFAKPYVRTARFRKNGDKPAWSARDEHPDSLIALMNMPFTPEK